MSEDLPTNTMSPWKIKPLSGKYYGTIIVSADGIEINVWLDGDGSYALASYIPSKRQMEKWGYTDHDPWSHEKEADTELLSDNHYERATTYSRACEIVNALNKSPAEISDNAALARAEAAESRLAELQRLAREALRQIKCEAVSLADAQVIALAAMEAVK